MAITATKIFDETIAGVKHQVWTVAWSATSSTTEVALAGVPAFGRIMRVKNHHTSGSAATYIPKIGNSATFVAGTLNEMLAGPAAGVAIYDSNSTGTNVGYVYYTTTATLYFRPNPNAGNDNVGTSVIWLKGEL
jgi:hypothetical protein